MMRRRLVGLAAMTALLAVGAGAHAQEEFSGACPASVRTLTASQLDRRCAIRTQGACAVVDAGKVSGSERFGALRYQLSRTDDGDIGGAVIFRPGPGGRLVPLICSKLLAGYYEHDDRPRIIHSRLGVLLALPPIELGTAGPQAPLLYRWTGGGWREVDLEGWQDVFERRIAPKYNGWRGVDYDFVHMTGSSFLYAPGDGHASPSGYASLRFTLAGNRLRLVHARVGSSEPVFDAICRTNPQCVSNPQQ